LNPSIEFLWENTYRAQQYEELFIGSDPTELALQLNFYQTIHSVEAFNWNAAFKFDREFSLGSNL